MAKSYVNLPKPQNTSSSGPRRHCPCFLPVCQVDKHSGLGSAGTHCSQNRNSDPNLLYFLPNLLITPFSQAQNIYLPYHFSETGKTPQCSKTKAKQGHHFTSKITCHSSPYHGRIDRHRARLRTDPSHLPLSHPVLNAHN